jgi:hypothetical protein
MVLRVSRGELRVAHLVRPVAECAWHIDTSQDVGDPAPCLVFERGLHDHVRTGKERVLGLSDSACLPKVHDGKPLSAKRLDVPRLVLFAFLLQHLQHRVDVPRLVEQPTHDTQVEPGAMTAAENADKSVGERRRVELTRS